MFPGVSQARASGFNEIQVSRFFDNLQQMYEKYKFSPNNIYNMDETGMLTVPNKIPKIISHKGKRCVGKIVSSERGTLITAVCCFSAGGNYVPPSLIFPRKREKSELIDGAPHGSLLMISDSGFINSDLFLKWIEHFQKHVRANSGNPVLLLLDNHSSHINLEVIKFCRKNSIVLLSLPPHSSHKLQPLDVGFFGPLKTAYAQEADKWMTSHPGRTITQFQVSSLFGLAYGRIASIEKAQKAFQATGIWPINQHIFTETDFAPSSVTDIPLTNQDENDTVSDAMEMSNIEIVVEDNSILDELQGQEEGRFKVIATADDINEPSTSKTNNDSDNKTTISPAKILPIPKLSHAIKRKRKGKRSEILTSSPYEEKLQEIVDSNKLKTVRKNLNMDCGTKKQCAENRKVFYCPGCGEKYKDPPEMDWIQCKLCKLWWHEICTTYSGQKMFKCEKCVPE